jgi:hypothetical protein
MPTAEEIARELESFYRHYIEVFNREDECFYDCFAYPYGIITGAGGLAVIASDDHNRKGFGRAVRAIKEQGWARSGIDSIKAWALADNLGMILADVTRYKFDNSVLEHIRACYMLRRDSAVWKIMTISEVKAPFLGPGHLARS